MEGQPTASAARRASRFAGGGRAPGQLEVFEHPGEEERHAIYCARVDCTGNGGQAGEEAPLHCRLPATRAGERSDCWRRRARRRSCTCRNVSEQATPADTAAGLTGRLRVCAPEASFPTLTDHREHGGGQEDCPAVVRRPLLPEAVLVGRDRGQWSGWNQPSAGHSARSMPFMTVV